MPRRTYDCFCYFNEDMILKLRLETLWSYVDYFVIAEAVYTQTGKPKPLNFDARKFSEYGSKLRYLVVDQFPTGTLDFWKNENHQRNCLKKGLFDARPDDLVIVSDLDEIPRPEALASYDPVRYKRGDLQQYFYAYYLNNLRMDGDKPAVWLGSKITTFRHLIEFFQETNSVRSYKSTGPLRVLRRAMFKRFHVQIIRNGGWHFTWVMTPEDAVKKMEAIAEGDFYKDEHRGVDYIADTFRSGNDLLDPHVRYIAQEVVEPDFPRFLVKHKDKYRQWLR